MLFAVHQIMCNLGDWRITADRQARHTDTIQPKPYNLFIGYGVRVREQSM